MITRQENFHFSFFFFHFKAANGKRILRIEREKRRLARRKSSSCLFSSTRFEGSRLTSRDSPRRDTTFLFSRQIIVLYTPLPRLFAPRFKDILRYLFILGRAPAFYPAWKGDQRERENPPLLTASNLLLAFEPTFAKISFYNFSLLIKKSVSVSAESKAK